MGAKIYFSSGKQNGAVTRVFFESPFPWPSAPPSKGTEVYVPGNDGKGCLKGVVTRVEQDRVLAESDLPTETMQEFLEGWQKVSDWLG